MSSRFAVAPAPRQRKRGKTKAAAGRACAPPNAGASMLPRRFLLPLVLTVALALAAVSGPAAPASDATAFMNELIGKALESLGNKKLTEADREKQFRVILDQDFDVPRIARFVLGPYWDTASEQERQKFLKLFEDYIVHAYTARFSQYNGEQVKVTGSRAVSETTALVNSQVLSTTGGPPTKVDWRVRRQDNDFKIVDINVEGVSLLLTQREQFGAVIQRAGDGVAGLNRTLEEKLASGDTSLAAPPLPERR
jgi:phospholipid transport system substrate-binding protein